jgi:hypothetical protein
MWRSVGLRLFGSQYFNDPHAVCEQRVLEALGDDRYRAALAEGGLLDLDTTVARALRDRPSESAVAPRVPTRVVGPRQHEPAASPAMGGGETAG